MRKSTLSYRLICSIFGCLLLVSAIVVYRLWPFAQGVVFIQEKGLDVKLGDIAFGTTVERIIQIKNEDLHRTVFISDLQRNCACTSAHLEKDQLLPGHATTLKLVVDAHRQAVSFSATTKLLWTYAGDLSQQSLDIRLYGRVVDLLTIVPSRLDFGDIQDSELTHTITAHLARGNSKTAWDSIRATSSNANLHVEISKIDADQFELKVFIFPVHQPTGPFSDNLTLTCYSGSNALPRPFSIPVVGYIASDLASSPKTLYFGAIRQGVLLKKEVTIYSKRKFHITSIVSGQSACTVAPFSRIDDYSQRIMCNFDSHGLRGILGDRLWVTVIEGTQPKEVVIPYIALIQ